MLRFLGMRPRGVIVLLVGITGEFMSECMLNYHVWQTVVDAGDHAHVHNECTVKCELAAGVILFSNSNMTNYLTYLISTHI